MGTYVSVEKNPPSEDRTARGPLFNHNKHQPPKPSRRHHGEGEAEKGVTLFPQGRWTWSGLPGRIIRV